jgi:uncharacterized protein (DUF1330 family)
MAKGYWIAMYRSVSNPDALAKYAKLAGPVIEGGGGKILSRGNPTRVYEAGVPQRSVVVEFPSVAAAIATYESPAYQQVRAILDGAAERDIRIVEGVS